VVDAPVRSHDSMVVRAATMSDVHLSGRTFHILNTSTPKSHVVLIDIRFTPSLPCPALGSNLAADGSTLVWSAPFNRIALSPVQDSLTFDLAIADSNHWSGNATIITHHLSGDSTVMMDSTWTVARSGVTDGHALPAGFSLGGIDPNPASTNATVRFTVGAVSRVRLEVINALGEIVTVMADDVMSARDGSASIDTRDLAPGMYWVRMTAGRGAAAARMIIAR
jgi:hypothetical protein